MVFKLPFLRSIKFRLNHYIRQNERIHSPLRLKRGATRLKINLENLGYKVIRFENKMVFDFLPSVLQEIKDNFKVDKL